jgi:hypothetical protein
VARDGWREGGTVIKKFEMGRVEECCDGAL